MGRLKILAILIGLTSCRVFYEVVEYLPDNSGNDLLFWKGVLRVDMKETILDRHVQNRDNRPKNVCTWEPNTTECFTMLSEQLLLKNASETSNTQQLVSKRWVFLGDSTMRYLYSHIETIQTNEAAIHWCKCQTIKAPTCNMYEAFGLTKKIGNWTPPTQYLEGPIDYGLAEPHCQDCFRCHSMLFHCERIPCNYTSTSYISVEFARDVEMQTELEQTNTTQESVARYLQNKECLKDPFICVVNTGIHDMLILDSDGDTFVENVAWYVTLIQPCCRHLIWIQLTAILDDEAYRQRNWVIELWNSKVQTLLQGDRFHNWTTVVDPYTVSMTWPHNDNVHLNQSYYEAFSALFSPFLLYGDLENPSTDKLFAQSV